MRQTAHNGGVLIPSAVATAASEHPQGGSLDATVDRAGPPGQLLSAARLSSKIASKGP